MKVFAAVVTLAMCAGLVVGTAWDSANNPSTWSNTLKLQLSQLPTSGKSVQTPWSDTYWPNYQGGIANRWQDSDSNYPGFNYKLYTLAELKSGSVDLNILSPAEKFDIYNSRYDYPLTNSEWTRTNSSDPMWEGICHGWAPAAGHYTQPNATTLPNKEGLRIPFGSSDVKALLSYFLAQYAQDREQSSFIAERCNEDLDQDPSKADNPECADINAGTFHVMVANLLGIARTPFVADIDRSIQVWNQPITEYSATLGAAKSPSSGAARGTVKEQPVSLTLYYTKETRPSQSAHEALILHDQYNYNLELDASGKILGGSYDDDQWHRLDFLWSEEAPDFYGYFSKLQTIYDSATTVARSAPRSVASRRATLADYSAIPVSGGCFNLGSYSSHTRRSWIVNADSLSAPLQLRFTAFNTRRFSDHVRVFEVSSNGEIGALLAVLHGSALPEDIVLRQGVSALVTFSIDHKSARRMSPETGDGFEICIA